MINKQNFDFKIIGGVLIYFVIIFLLGVIGYLPNIRASIIGNFEESYSSFSESMRNFSNFGDIFSDYTKLKDENEELKLEITNLIEENADFQKQIKDVEFIYEKGLADFDYEYELIPARVYAYDSSDFDKFFINKGAKQNISNNDIVILGEYLIGRVEETFENYSVVRIFATDDYDLNVVSLNSKARGIAARDIGKNIEILEINNDFPLSENDIFVTEGEEGNLPYGLIIGRVSNIIGSPAEPTKKAEITNDLDYYDLSRVYVVDNE